MSYFKRVVLTEPEGGFELLHLGGDLPRPADVPVQRRRAEVLAPRHWLHLF